MLSGNDRSDRSSDGNVERAAKTRLARTGYSLLKTIECSFQDGTMELRGRVPSYYHKQLAQEALRKVNHVKQLVNNIEVP
jgi:osmotically-inducible protein OsmY